MALAVYHWFGFFLGVLVFLMVGALLAFGSTKLAKFEKTTFGTCLPFWVVSIGVIWAFELIFNPPYEADAPANILGRLPIWSVKSIVHFSAEIAIMMLLTKYWFKEAWLGTTIVAGLVVLFQFVLSAMPPLGAIIFGVLAL